MPPALIENLQYPTGRFTFNPSFSENEAAKHVQSIRDLPARLHAALQHLDPARWDTPYRPGGWTVRQVVHHLADSHANAFMRFKLALTENHPTIKPYLEDRWAELPDSTTLSPIVSAQLLEALHIRWVSLMEHMQPADWHKTLFHPERRRDISLWEMLALYAWHGEHHLAHIQLVKGRG